MTASAVFLLLASIAAAATPPPPANVLQAVPSRDRRILHRWHLDGTPHGIAITADGTLYVGLARPQKIVAVDPRKGTILSEVVLDHVEMASTKELVSLRLTADGKHLLVANGSDESATIVEIPSLHIVREIGLEGETIRDALPDPGGRFIYLLGRSVHVYTADGEKELKALGKDPMAIASSTDGRFLAVVESEDFPSGKASVAVMYDTDGFREVAREPLQTDRRIDSLLFAASDRALVFLASDWMGEKSLRPRTGKALLNTGQQMKMTIDFGDLVNGEGICLPDLSGPQIAVAGGRGSANIYFAEKHCPSGEKMSASERQAVPASIYGTAAWAIAYDSSSGSLFATDPSGSLTQYRLPKPGSE